MTLISTSPGIAVVGVSPRCCGFLGQSPSRLLSSTNLRTWHDITPPQARQHRHGGYPFFESASFATPNDGWVVGWNPANVAGTLFHTIDGGQHWTARADGTHTASLGGATYVDTLSPTTAFRATLQPTGPIESTQVTYDGGSSWRTLPWSRRRSQPFEMVPDFVTSTLGFEADGIPPTDPVVDAGPGRLYRTIDGGRHWTRSRPPIAARCRHYNGRHASCMIGAPTFVDASHGVLPYVMLTPGGSTVGFDTSADRGISWASAGRPRTVSPHLSRKDFILPQSLNGHFPLVSVASATAWWIAISHGTRSAIYRTTDAGAHWTKPHLRVLPGSVTAIDGLGQHDALATCTIGPHNHRRNALFVTRDGGRRWHVLPTERL